MENNPLAHITSDGTAEMKRVCWSPLEFTSIALKIVILQSLKNFYWPDNFNNFEYSDGLIFNFYGIYVACDIHLRNAHR